MINMSFLTPDNFAGNPYGGGTNQGMHVNGGSACLWLASLWLIAPWSILAAGGAILLLEWVQLKFMGGGGKDYAADLLYWYAGLACYAQWPELGYLVPAVSVAAFAIEFGRIKWTM